MNPFLRYWLNLSPTGKQEFAARAGTTVGACHQAARGYKTGGKLAITVETAVSLEEASNRELMRGELNNICRECPYVCRGGCSVDG